MQALICVRRSDGSLDGTVTMEEEIERGDGKSKEMGKEPLFRLYQRWGCQLMVQRNAGRHQHTLFPPTLSFPPSLHPPSPFSVSSVPISHLTSPLLQPLNSTSYSFYPPPLSLSPLILALYLSISISSSFSSPSPPSHPPLTPIPPSLSVVSSVLKTLGWQVIAA